jgi:hypothetical protein
MGLPSSRDRASVNRWKGLFAVSWGLAAIFLWPTLGRFNDGDDSYLFYDAGLRSWSEVLGMTALPPGRAPVTATPDLGNGAIPSEPVFVFGRWRPFSQFVYTKALWTLGLTPRGYRSLSWVVCWLASLGLAQGAVSVFALAEAVPPEAPWALATLLFWSVPTLFSSAIAFFTVNLASLLFGLGTLALCRGGRQRGPKAWELAAACALFFLACESHENAWWLLLWLGTVLGTLKISGKLGPRAPRFWGPLALLGAYILVYRSLLPGPGPNWTGGGNENYSFAPALVWSRFSYLILTPLNGLSRPLVSLLGADISPLDVEPASFPFAILLTLGSLAWIFSRVFSKSPLRSERWVKRVFAATLAVGCATVLPYCIVSNLRFIYYSKLLADLLAIGAVFLWMRLKRPRGLALAPWIAAGMATTALVASHPSWLDSNARGSEAFAHALLARHPDLRDCSPAHPCCMNGLPRKWGLNEWVLSYNLGAASKTPAFYPEQWPGARCDRHFDLGK